MPRVERAEAAEHDINEILDHIALVRLAPQGARNLSEAFEAAIHFHAEHPMLGESMPQLGKNVRAFSCGTKHNRRAYVVLFRPLKDGIEVLRVLKAGKDLNQILIAGP